MLHEKQQEDVYVPHNQEQQQEPDTSMIKHENGEEPREHGQDNNQEEIEHVQDEELHQNMRNQREE